MLSDLFERQLLGRKGLRQPFLADFTSDETLGGATITWDPCEVQSLPFCTEFCKVLFDGRLLAVGDEEGIVSIMNTAQPLPDAIAGARLGAQWQAHNNAIFDLRWCQRDERLITASGDKTIGLWDTMTATSLSRFRGHKGSVRTICSSQRNPSIFASGARDGALMVWDSRCLVGNVGFGDEAVCMPVSSIQDVHRPSGSKSPAMKTVFNRVKALESYISVTAVLLLAEDQVLASACAADEIVKLWDLRKLTHPCAELTPKKLRGNQQHPALLSSLAGCTASAMRHHGVTSLALDHTGSRLLVSVHNNVHHLYDALRPHLPPGAAYTGHKGSSFYSRTCFSPDGTHFMSGSSDSNAYIWEIGLVAKSGTREASMILTDTLSLRLFFQDREYPLLQLGPVISSPDCLGAAVVTQVERPAEAPLKLQGHDGEVMAVAWCPSDIGQVVTCGDDSVVKVWRLNRAEEGPRLQQQQSQRVQSPQGPSRPVDPATSTPDGRLARDQAAATPLRTPLGAIHQQLLTPPAGTAGGSGSRTLGRFSQTPITAFFSTPAQNSSGKHARQVQESTDCQPRAAQTPPGKRQRRTNAELQDVGATTTHHEETALGISLAKMPAVSAANGEELGADELSGSQPLVAVENRVPDSDGVHLVHSVRLAGADSGKIVAKPAAVDTKETTRPCARNAENENGA